MDRLYKLNWKVALFLFLLIDLFTVAMGMGVPFFTILLGFPLGRYIARRVSLSTEGTRVILARVLKYAVVTSAFSFAVMAVIWAPSIKMLFDPKADLANYGIPLILYSPRASFIGWQILMIVISPFLQLMATIFSSYLTLLSVGEKW